MSRRTLSAFLSLGLLLLPSQLGGRLHVGGDLLAERLHALAVQGILPTLGRLLKLPLRSATAPAYGPWHGG